MKFHLNGLADEFGRVAALTAALATGAMLPAHVYAQDDIDTVEVDSFSQGSDEDDLGAEGSTELGAIQITGSRLRRTDFETAQPVLVLTREDIERTGLVSIGDILQNIPQAGAALNTAFNNGGTGATEIDLRNLGSNRVLVLVNGRRWVGGVRTLNTSGVDLNTIPISIIDSIEVLKDGASAIYGSDAIAGVIVTSGKREFLAGADIEKVHAITDPAEAFALAEQYKAFLRRLELCEKPVVAALNGTALGGDPGAGFVHHLVAVGGKLIEDAHGLGLVGAQFLALGHQRQ